MRHRKHSNQLGVKKEHREALMANLAASLIEHGRIQTTLKKAKALRPFAERLVTLAKKGGIANRRLAASRLRDEVAVKLLFDERVEEFRERNGGYTRIYKLGNRRGDAAEMAIIEWVGAGDTGHGKKRRKGGAKKQTAKAETAPASEEKPPVSEETPAVGETEEPKQSAAATADEKPAGAKPEVEETTEGPAEAATEEPKAEAQARKKAQAEDIAAEKPREEK